MKRRVTMQDIADRLNITKVSVSKALNNQIGVSQSLRTRILETAEEMGYEARKPEGLNKTFAFLMQKRFFLETYKFYNVIFYHMNNLAKEKNCPFTPFVLEYDEERIQLPSNVDGVFIVGEIPDACIKSIPPEVPVVAIDFYRNYLDVNYVLVDNFYLGYYITHYLIDRGHRDIGFVGNINQTSSINDRYFGYIKALQNNNLASRRGCVITNDADGVYRLDIDLPERLPTAFVCHCDMAAYFLMSSLKSIGKSVPDDVSLVSFDNTDLSLSTTPQLTSMDIDKKEIAVTAFSVMEQIIHGKEGCRRYYISTRLMERDSTKKVD